MSKRDWIWVAIRIFGLYLLIHAVTALPSIISQALLVRFSLTFPASDMKDPLSGIYDRLGRTAISSLAGAIAQFVLYTVIGLYLVRGGKWLHRIVCPPEDEKDANRTVT